MTTEDPNNPYQVPATDSLQRDNHTGFAHEPRSVPGANGLTWVSDGWELFKRAPGPMVLLFLVYFIISMLLGVIPLVNFISPILTTVFMGGIFIALARLDRSGELKIEDLFAAFNSHLTPLILMGLLLAGVSVILVGGAVALGMGTIMNGGSNPGMGSMLFFMIVLLLAIALFFMLYFVVFYATMLVVLGDQSLGDSMSNAFGAFVKNVLPFLLNSIVISVIMVIAMIPFGLGLLIAGPVMFTSMYASYKDIFAAE